MMIKIKNKDAIFNYHILKEYTAGIVLQGTEIKSLRHGKASFQDSYCLIEKNELFIKNLYIAEYSHGTYANHNPLRLRKLLLHKFEIRKIYQAVREQGITIIPLRLFINNHGLAKLDLALGKGKKLYDKRETIKKREVERNIRQNFK